MNEAKETKLLHAEFYKKGKEYFQNGDYQPAVNSLLKALECDPENADVLFELGKTYYAMGDSLRAIKYLERNLKAYPENANAHALLAKCHIVFGEYDSAIKELDKSCLLQATPEIYYEMGLVYEAKGDYSQSVEYFKKAKESGVDMKEAGLFLGRAYRETGDYDLSIKELEKLQFLSPYRDSVFYKNKLLNEIEISQRKTVLESKPMVLGIALTHNCNIRCRMCRYWSDPWDVPEVIIKEIMELIPYLQHAYWQGGEPFFSKYFKELFEKGSAYPTLLQTIVTNGLLINESWAKKLVRSNVNIIWSIDSPNKETYDYIRDGAHFEDLLDALNIVNKYRDKFTADGTSSPNFKTIMQATIMKYNYRELEDLIHFAKTQRFDGINIIPIRYVTSDENIFYHNDKKAIGYLEKTLPAILTKYESHGFRVFNQLPVNLDVSDVAAVETTLNHNDTKTDESAQNVNCRPPVKDTKMLCYWPWKSLYILYKGLVRPYGFCEYDIGDIKVSPLKDIWNGLVMQEYRRRILENSNLQKCSIRCTSGIMPKDTLKLA